MYHSAMCYKNNISEVIKSFSDVYCWNNAIDIEAIQVLLCIELHADQSGFADMAEVRRYLEIPADRLTRTLRLLQGQNKSISLSASTGPAREPLVVVKMAKDSQINKRLGLTMSGKTIVTNILDPVVKKQEEILEYNLVS